MTRKELYSHIVGFGLQDEVKSRCNRNYTQVSNDDLEVIVKDAIKGLEATNKSSKEANYNCSRLGKLVEILHKKNILLNSEVAAIMNT